MRIKALWKTLCSTMRATYQEAFSSDPFRIVGKNTDSLTHRAAYLLKAKNVPAEFSVTTSELIHNDRYFLGLSSSSRKAVADQYVREIVQPLALIEELPIAPDIENRYQFKIFLLEEEKIICGSAAYFMQEKKILDLLSKQDVITITMAYCLECFSHDQAINPSSIKQGSNLLR